MVFIASEKQLGETVRDTFAPLYFCLFSYFCVIRRWSQVNLLAINRKNNKLFV